VSRLIAVLDANVLYGITPTDLLITLAVRDAYRPHWSEAILDEAIRNLTTNRHDLDPDKITQRFTLMNRALDGASIPAPSGSLVDEMTNDINDRHVLATAVMVGADVIVTENLRHFPPSASAPRGIIAMSLDDFISELLDEQPAVVGDAITEMADRRNRPPMTPDELLTILEQYIPRTVERLR
jgi:predicted nucleic acid-binding protein